MLQLGDQAAGAIARGQGEIHPADAFTTRRALLAQRLKAAHASRVARAPRFHAAANPGFLLREELVELALAHRVVRERFGLALLVFAEVARIGRETPAVELEDSVRDTVEEAPVVRHEDHASGERGERLFQPLDRIDVEMIGRLVEQKQVGLEHQCPRERDALAQTARERIDVRVGGKLQAIECRLDAMLDRPRVRAIERFVQRVHAIEILGVGGGVIVEEELPRFADAFRNGLEDRPVSLERRLLRDARDLHTGCKPDLAVVGLRGSRGHLQQARLPRAIAADEADMLALLDHQVRMVEHRHVAVGKRDVGQLEERFQFF